MSIYIELSFHCLTCHSVEVSQLSCAVVLTLSPGEININKVTSCAVPQVWRSENGSVCTDHAGWDGG